MKCFAAMINKLPCYGHITARSLTADKRNLPSSMFDKTMERCLWPTHQSRISTLHLCCRRHDLLGNITVWSGSTAMT